MKKSILLFLFVFALLLFGCSQPPEITIQKLNNYEYNQKTVFDTDEYNELWNTMGKGSYEQWYHLIDNKLNVSLDYLHVYNSGDSIHQQLYRSTGVNIDQNFLHAWWWNLGIIESKQGIEDESSFLSTIKQSDEKFGVNGCELTIGAKHSTISQLFSGDRYITAGYKDYLPISEDLIGKCPYANSMLTFPTFVFDRKSPKRILVIVDTDGRNGLSYWKGMGTLKW